MRGIRRHLLACRPEPMQGGLESHDIPALSGGAAAPVDARALATVINRWPAHPPSVAPDQCHRKLVPVSTRASIKEPRNVENESRGIRRAGTDRAAGEAGPKHRAA